MEVFKSARVRKTGPWVPSFNVAPTDSVLVVAEINGVDWIEEMTWGFVSPSGRLGPPTRTLINARAETVMSKSIFARPFLAGQRLLVPATGFFEWKQVPGSKRKQPYFIHSASGEELVFAGLWDGTNEQQSFTIITCAANEMVAPVHDRMPAVLPQDLWELWLGADARVGENLDALRHALHPAPYDLLTMHPVDRRVGSVANNSPDLIVPIEPEGSVLHDGPSQTNRQQALTLFEAHG